MAARSEAVYPVTWKSGKLASWLVTVDHKRIGIMYICTSLVFFCGGGIAALLMRAQLATPNEHFLTKNSYDEVLTFHGTSMIFLVVVPILAGFAQLPRAADDRRARHGVPAAERVLVLGVPARRHRPLRRWFAVRRRAARRLVVVSAALGDASSAPATARTTGSSRSTSSRSRRSSARSTSSSRSSTCARAG